MSGFREFKPRYFLPVCVETQAGFIGGPPAYKEVDAATAATAGPIIIESGHVGREPAAGTDTDDSPQ